METPPFGFVLLFLLFSLLFFWNSYTLWFKTDQYYKNLYNSITREPSVYPFRNFFFKRLENRKRWEVEQKIFSLLGIAAVVTADMLVVMAYLG